MRFPRLRWGAPAVVGAVLALVLTACGSGSDSSDDAASGGSGFDPVTIGVGVDATYAPFYLADQEGLFKKAGLDVKLVQFAAGGLAVDAIAGKQVQAAAASPTTVITKLASNPDLRATFQFFSSDSDVSVVARKEITSADQIKSFAYMPGLSEYDAHKYLESEGVDPSSVKFVKSNDPSTIPALTAKGDVDAYVLWEPWPTNGVKQGLHILASTGSFGLPATQDVVFDKTWLAEHGEEAAKVAQVLGEASKAVNDDANAGAEATTKAAKIPTADALATVKIIDFEAKDITAADVTAAKDQAEYFVGSGALKTAPDIDAAFLTSWFSTNVK